ncbi:hypothetical protein LTR86_003842 [Recurvomyces mirabilis]|nr:hypothetical protein LTR86_003842 [Recurvomyces mirabilis]
MSTRYFSVTEHTVECQHIRGYYRSTANSQEDVLHLAVKQYRPRNNLAPQEGDVTIIAAHAAGMSKELYEPFFDDLLEQWTATAGPGKIRSILIADAATHGQSGVMNEGQLGIDYDWWDHARDLLHMVNVFRKEIIRPIVGIGHSMGGTNIMQLSHLHPRLFAGIVCFEPVTWNRYAPQYNFANIYFSGVQIDRWPSREVALERLRKSRMRSTWDSRVVAKYEEYALRKLPTLLYPNAPQNSKGAEAVTLTMTIHHDVRAFARGAHPSADKSFNEFRPDSRTHPDLTQAEFDALGQPAYQPAMLSTFAILPLIRPACLYIHGEGLNFANNMPDFRDDFLSRIGVGPGGSGGEAAGKVQRRSVEGSHFAPLEHPRLVAEVSAKWIAETLVKFREDEAKDEAEWKSLDRREKTMLSADWMFWAEKAYKPKTPKNKTTSRL